MEYQGSSSQDEIQRLRAAIERQNQQVQDLKATVLEHIIDKVPTDAKLRTYEIALVDLKKELAAKGATITLMTGALKSIKEAPKTPDEVGDGQSDPQQNSAIAVIKNMVTLADTLLHEVGIGGGSLITQDYSLLLDGLKSISTTGSAFVNVTHQRVRSGTTQPKRKLSDMLQMPAPPGPFPPLENRFAAQPQVMDNAKRPRRQDQFKSSTAHKSATAFAARPTASQISQAVSKDTMALPLHDSRTAKQESALPNLAELRRRADERRAVGDVSSITEETRLLIERLCGPRIPAKKRRRPSDDEDLEEDDEDVLTFDRGAGKAVRGVRLFTGTSYVQAVD